MVKLLCCDTFRPQFMTEDKLYACLSCDRCSINCICGTINTLPPKPMRKNCSNGKCLYHVLHCDCNKKTVLLMNGEESFTCTCGFDFEIDVYIGVKIA